MTENDPKTGLAAQDKVPPRTSHRRRESTEERRTAIAAAAREIICKKGFEGLRTRDIADRVGINIATLHYHVPTKDDLIDLVAEALQSEFITHATRDTRQHMTPRQQLRHEIVDHANMIRDKPEIMILLREFAEKSRRDPSVARRHQQLQRRWIDAVARILQAGIEDGTFRSDIDPEAGAALFVGALIGSGKLIAPGLAAPERLHDELERFFLSRSPTPGITE